MLATVTTAQTTFYEGTQHILDLTEDSQDELMPGMHLVLVADDCTIDADIPADVLYNSGESFSEMDVDAQGTLKTKKIIAKDTLLKDPSASTAALGVRTYIT